VAVLGIYRIAVTHELLDSQLGQLFGEALPEADRKLAEQHVREQLATVALIEVMVCNRDPQFRVDDFTQAIPGLARDNWQAPWAETYLTDDGEALLVERWSSTPPDDPLRIAFYLHFWRDDLPLETSYGPVTCPTSRPMPERLRRLAPFEVVD
jgi:hypothetical protein